MAILVEEGLRPNGDDLVVGQRPKDHFYDSEEYRAGGQPGLRLRASAEGVHIHGMPSRMLGFEQVRGLARELSKAADEAEKRGAPDRLMEDPCG